MLVLKVQGLSEPVRIGQIRKFRPGVLLNKKNEPTMPSKENQTTNMVSDASSGPYREAGIVRYKSWTFREDPGNLRLILKKLAFECTIVLGQKKCNPVTTTLVGLFMQT